MACLHKNKLWDSRWCPVTCFYCTGEQERTCKHNKVTHADRIRAMTDEELAETLIRYNDLCDMFMADDGMKYYDFEAAKEAELEWLQQPCKEGS